MSVGPFWCYYGGKWRVAPRYPAPHFDTIVEPFAGAAGYSCRYPSRRVHLYDVDEHVVGTWRYLLRTSAAEIASLPDVPEGGTVDDLPVCQEARWLIGWWCNTGSTTPKKRRSKWAEADGGWAAARQRVAADADKIRHWTIKRLPWWDVPDIEATWFVDPVYQVAGRFYRFSDISKDQQQGGWAGGSTADDHGYAALGAWCRSRRGQVIVCEQSGADWLPFRPFGHIKGQARQDGTDRPNLEVIWTKGPGTQVGLFGEAA